MARNTQDTPDEPSGESKPTAGAQHEFVAARRPDPAAPPAASIELTGMLGDSDRPGHQRLYFTRELDRYAEFKTDDVIGTEDVAAEQPPLVGLSATTVHLRREAAIEFTRLRVARPIDEFDLDVRLAAAAPVDDVGFPESHPFGPCTGGTVFDTATVSCDFCGGGGPFGTHQGPCLETRRTCETRCFACESDNCPTRRGATCVGTCNTCLTRCNQRTCVTCGSCAGTCNTCRTCETRCGTCNTCDTCNRHIPACQF